MSTEVEPRVVAAARSTGNFIADEEVTPDFITYAEQALAAADAADAEQGIHRVKVDDAVERIRKILVLPTLNDRVNGDPTFIDAWELASEEVLARLPKITAALTGAKP